MIKQYLRVYRSFACSIQAERMAETTCTHAIDDIKNDVVANGKTGWNRIQFQCIPGAPRHIMIGAGRIAAYAECTQQVSCGVIQSQAATKNVYAADFAARHWICWFAEIGGVAAVCNAGINGIACLQAEQAAAGLYRAVKIGGGQRKAAVQAE